jgi:hypothetical protein
MAVDTLATFRVQLASFRRNNKKFTMGTLVIFNFNERNERKLKGGFWYFQCFTFAFNLGRWRLRLKGRNRIIRRINANHNHGFLTGK